MKRVVVTGMGIVSPIGNSVMEAASNGIAGTSGIRSCERYLYGNFGEQVACRVAGVVEDLDTTGLVDAKYAASYEPAALYALAATEEALKMSGIDFDSDLCDRTSVILGTAAPGSVTYHQTLHQVFVEGRAHELPGRTSLNISGNLPTALIALRHKFRGPNFGIVNACASGATSIGVAADTIRTGRADVAVAGGAESCIGLALLGSMGNAGAINPTADPARACRPFNRDRAGLIMAEGAGVLILEDRDHAVARGATIIAELLGDSLTDDAYHLYHPDAEGEVWARAMRLALKNANVAPSDVSYVSAHAASTPRGDLAETRALKKIMSGHAYDISVSATKSMHGHAYGATGAIETILALEGVRRGQLMPTINLTDPDPECDLNYVANASQAGRPEIMLKNSFGFGGTNACLVFQIPQASAPALA